MEDLTLLKTKAEEITQEDEKRRSGLSYNRKLISAVDTMLSSIDMDLPENRGISFFRTFKDLSENQKLYVTFLIS